VNAYAQVSLQTGVAAADPHRLVLMLFEGARAAVANARGQMQRGDAPAKGNSISRAISIIDEGLKASLDLKAGGDMAAQLHALYEYMVKRLFVANLENRIEALDEVTKLLTELHEAWSAIAPREASTAG
jgi:flagellar protein FliS